MRVGQSLIMLLTEYNKYSASDWMDCRICAKKDNFTTAYLTVSSG